jgi:hypothetical protein
MQPTPANILVDVKQLLSREHGDALVSELAAIRGVSAARVSPRTGRLLIVDYDPKLTGSKNILGTVVRHGFDARLIGM